MLGIHLALLVPVWESDRTGKVHTESAGKVYTAGCVRIWGERWSEGWSERCSARFWGLECGVRAEWRARLRAEGCGLKAKGLGLWPGVCRLGVEGCA